MYQKFKTVRYSLRFVTADDGPEILSDLFTIGFYVQVTPAARAVSRLRSPHPASSFGLQKSDTAAAGNDAEDYFEVFIDDRTTGKELAVPGFDRQSYARLEIWLTIF